ncbi:hypothetical protein Tco_0818714 [Tanacetum coccineum]
MISEQPTPPETCNTPSQIRSVLEAFGVTMVDEFPVSGLVSKNLKILAYSTERNYPVHIVETMLCSPASEDKPLMKSIIMKEYANRNLKLTFK